LVGAPTFLQPQPIVILSVAKNLSWIDRRGIFRSADSAQNDVRWEAPSVKVSAELHSGHTLKFCLKFWTQGIKPLLQMAMSFAASFFGGGKPLV
jgi:hypothetical protein